MNGSRAAFTPSPPHDMTWPTPGSQTMRAIYSMAIRKLFEELKALRIEPKLSDETRQDYRAWRAVIAGFLPGNPGAVASLLRHPVVAAPLRCLRDGTAAADDCVAELVGQSLFRLGNVGALSSPIEIRRAPRALLDPWRQVSVELPHSEAALTFSAGGVRHGAGLLQPSRGAFASLPWDAVLATLDNNPVREVEAHPDKRGSRADLGSRELAEWRTSMTEATALLRLHLPELFADLELVVRQIVPVGFQSEHHDSASYREAIGTIYMSLHPSPVVMAEGLAHELGHNKLNALLELDPLIESGEAMFASPFRPDPRPLGGVLLAVHAFLPIERFYERLEAVSPSPEIRRRREEIAAKNRECAELLHAHARPTRVGRGLLDEISRLTGLGDGATEGPP